MEKCNPVSTPGLQVTDKDMATEEKLPEVLAGLYRRATGRLLHVAGQRSDAQQAVKQLARGVSCPTNIHWARLKRVMRYLMNKRISIRKFEPTASDARYNELAATSDSECGGCVKTRKTTTGIVLRHAGSTIATMSRTQGSVSLSSAEAEYYGTVSALAEAKQVQEIFGEYHEDTHFILETDSSAARANAERLWMWKNEAHQCEEKVLARRDHEPRSMVEKKVGTKNNVADGLTKAVNQQVLGNILTILKIELLETTHKHVSINLIVAKSIQNELMGEPKSDACSRGRQSKYWAHERREEREGKFGKLVRAS